MSASRKMASGGWKVTNVHHINIYQCSPYQYLPMFIMSIHVNILNQLYPSFQTTLCSRYHHFNVTEGIVDEVGPDCEKEGLRQRKRENLNINEEKSGTTEEEKDKEKKQVDKKSVSKDPLRWFGLMPPSSMRRAQVYLQSCPS